MRHKFTNRAITTVHDNLLADLYSLTLDTVYYENIDGDPYLINETIGRGYNIGLRVKIPTSMLTINNEIKDYNDLCSEEQELTKEKLKDRLFFSNQEILLANILLDKYLFNNNAFDISFKEIEGNYRKYVKATRVQLTDYNYKRYIEIINKLASKEIFISTKANFRDKKYGVNNLSFQQPFLILFDYYKKGRNDIAFSYSFDRFGKAIKLSGRYSVGVPPSAYSCNLNQGMLHAVYYFLGKEIFWKKWLLKNHPRLDIYKYFKLDIRKLMQEVHYDTKSSEAKGYSVASKMDGYKSLPNKNRTYRRLIKYVLMALKEMKANNFIYDYKEDYIYEESENFVNKHEEEYVGDHLTLVHMFSVDDIGQDVDISITIYLEHVSIKTP